MAIPDPGTWTASLVTTTQMNARLRDVENWLLNPPHVFGYRTANKSITDQVFTVYDMDAELYDWSVSSMHSTSTNNSRLIAPEQGIYTVQCQLDFGNIGQTVWQLQVRKNAAGSSAGGSGVFLITLNGAGGGLSTIAQGSGDVLMNAGDYVEMFGRPAFGGTPPDWVAGAALSFVSLLWRSKQ